MLSQARQLALPPARALLMESDEEWVQRLVFDGITGFYYNSTFQTMVRAYLLREQLGEKFGELTNLVVMWSP